MPAKRSSADMIGSQINEVRTDGDLEALRRDLAWFEQTKLHAAEIPPHGLDLIRNGVRASR
jgi:hypothetical protein